MPWHEFESRESDETLAAAQLVWTQSAFSEYASAAAFADIAASLLAAQAPIDLVAAAGDFVVDEVLHTELFARVAMSLGGAVPLEVNFEKLVRPPVASDPLVRAAELLVRTSCVGEVLTVPVLKASRSNVDSELLHAVLTRVVRDESHHAQLGFWFLEWASPRLTDEHREHLGNVASDALASFAPLFVGKCEGTSVLGVLDCATYDPAFASAIVPRIIKPLANFGIVVRPDSLVGLPGSARGRTPCKAAESAR
jgi:hypothetical protein